MQNQPASQPASTGPRDQNRILGDSDDSSEFELVAGFVFEQWRNYGVVLLASLVLTFALCLQGANSQALIYALVQIGLYLPFAFTGQDLAHRTSLDTSLFSFRIFLSVFIVQTTMSISWILSFIYHARELFNPAQPAPEVITKLIVAALFFVLVGCHLQLILPHSDGLLGLLLAYTETPRYVIFNVGGYGLEVRRLSNPSGYHDDGERPACPATPWSRVLC